jgi:hypothetical protein
MNAEKSHKFVAFLSYSHADRAVAERLHKALEAYQVPKELGGHRLRPIFRDHDDLQSGGVLSERLRDALHSSQHLVILCSTAAAQSSWVNQEAQAFVDSGRTGAIIPVIVDKEWDGDADLVFPPALRGLGLLAADLRARPRAGAGGGDGWRDGFLKIVAGLLDAPLDVVRRRHAVAERRRLGLRVASIVAIFTATLLLGLPVAEWRRRVALVDDAREVRDTTLSSYFAVAALPPGGSIFAAAPDDALELATPMLLRLSQSVLPRAYTVMLPINQSDPTVLMADSRSLRRWRLRTGAIETTALNVSCNENPSTPWTDCAASALAASAQGAVAVGIADGQIVILGPEPVQRLQVPAPVSALQFSASGEVLIAAAHNGQLYAFDLRSSTVTRTRNLGFVAFALLEARNASGERRLVAANAPEIAFSENLEVSEQILPEDLLILNNFDLSDTRLWAPGLADPQRLPPIPRSETDAGDSRFRRSETMLLFQSADRQFVLGSAQTEFSVARQLFVASAPNFDSWYRVGPGDTRLPTHLIGEFVLVSTDNALVATDMNRAVALGRLMEASPGSIRAAACAGGSLDRVASQTWQGLHLWESDFMSVGDLQRAALSERLSVLDVQLCRRRGLLSASGWAQIPESLASLALRP